MFELTPDHQAIADVAQQYADELLAPNAVEWDRTKHFPIDTIRKGAQFGLGGMYVREDVGGSGLGRLDTAVIIEAVATGCPSLASYISIHNMTAGMIDRYGDERQRVAYLPDLCSMERLASYCLTEPGAGSDAAAITTRADREGHGYRLTGVKQFISGAGASSVYVVMARTGAEGSQGISAFIVDIDTPGLSFGPNENKMGWNAQPTRQVVLDGVLVPADNRLGAEGDGFRIAMHGLNGGRVNIAASSLGGARSAMERTIRYMHDRQTFGRSLHGHQALQFQLADMATELEAARMLLWRAAQALDTQAENAVQLCAMAKKFATDTGFAVANRALQIHGGYGYLAEYGIEKIVRDLRVHQILEGTNEIMQMVIARALAAR